MATEHGAKAWRRLPVNQCLRTDFPRKRSVQKKNYRSEGRFPVIDQGAGLAGYSDDESLVNVGPLPLILFGDHTRKLKFLDFPFVTGADGTRLIRAREEVANPLFLFYALRAVPIPNRGYNRHFQLLKQATILVPEDLRTQDSVARFLADLEGLAGIALSRAGAMARLRAALLAKIFREGLRGEPLRETEIGPLPASWRVASLGEVTRRMQYGLSIRGGPAGAMPILRMNCQQDGRVEFRNLQFVTLDERQRAAFLLQPGDILFNRTNSFELVGRAAIFDSPREAVFASYLIRVSTDEAAALPGFLNHYLCAAAAQARLKSLATRGVSQSNISASRLRTFPVPIPQMAEQREMASTLDQLTLSVIGARRRAALLQSLFSAILARLMTGELRLPAEPQEADG